MNPSFSCEIEVRFADIDAYGHVNNAVYFTYLETARTKVFAQHFIDFMDSGLFFVVAQAECNFKKAIKLADSPVTVEFHIEGMGRSSFTVVYQLFGPKKQLFATAKTVMVALDAKRGTPTAMPTDIMEKLAGG